MQGRLVFSLNDDGTVTLRCDADSFFAHADEIRRLLMGDAEEEGGEALPPVESASSSGGASATEPDGDAAAPSPAPAAAASAVGGGASSEKAPTASPAKAPSRGPAKAPSRGPAKAPSRASASSSNEGGGRSPRPSDGASEFDPAELSSLWTQVFPAEGGARESRDLSLRGTELLVAGYYLTRLRGFEAFNRADLQRALDSLPDAESAEREAKTGTLIHLTRRGWLERVRRGYYRLSRRGVDRITNLADLAPRPAPSRSRPRPQVPNLNGLSRFLREVPSNRKWRRVLLVGYFLQEHCGIEEFDQRLIAACFQRLRGVDAPGSLPALISQVLHKRHGYLERGSRRGMYRLTPKALEELRRNPRVADANAIHRARGVGPSDMAKTG